MCLTFFLYEFLIIWEILHQVKEENLAIMILTGHAATTISIEFLVLQGIFFGK